MSEELARLVEEQVTGMDPLTDETVAFVRESYGRGLREANTYRLGARDGGLAALRMAAETLDRGAAVTAKTPEGTAGAAADQLRVAAHAMNVEAARLDGIDREASAGPWRVDESHGRDITDEGWSYYGIHAGSGPKPREIAEMRWESNSLAFDDDAVRPREDADLIVHRRNTLARDAAMLRATAAWLLEEAQNLAYWATIREDISEVTAPAALAVARAFMGKENDRG